MMNALINAYAVNPDWGSEQGMGWNWVINLAKFCHVDVITEGEFRKNIERELKNLPQKDNIRFHYLPVSDKVREMCWNQGDWRFYLYYRKWQKRALRCAKYIIENYHIDVIHQLNMIGFREPGYLWKIENIPFIWGPVGGMEMMPMSYLNRISSIQRIFNSIKNVINYFQYKYSPRVRSAIKRSDIIISAVKGVQTVLRDNYHKDSILINETGVEINSDIIKVHSSQNKPLKIIWVGKFDFRKQLPLALRSIIAMNKKDVEFHICGYGSKKNAQEMLNIAQAGGISSICHWHGNIPNTEVRHLMAESDILFFTSIMEATSTVVLEAISVGLPILCFNTCGFGPIVKNFAGITIDLSDPNKSVTHFAEELLSVYNNRERLNEISKKIISKRESLTWEAKAFKTVQLYKSLIN